MRGAYITGLAGDVLEDGERSLLSASRPAGIILFARNCVSPDQIRALVSDANAAIDADDVLVMIDQEGGRVQRLRPPHWRELPPAAAYGDLYPGDPAGTLSAARLAAQLTAQDLRSLGINTNCAPVLDVPVEGAHSIIGDRAYGSDCKQVAALGRAVAEGYIAGGVVPVIKHIPGHGRANADSHVELPVVDTPRADLEATCFAPFHALRDIPAAMTAHVVFSAIDPRNPASTSIAMIEDVIRSKIGYDGFLMSDDLGMKALSGPLNELAAAVIRAGSDVALHCSGNLCEMEAVAAGTPALEGVALRRFEACVEITRRPSRLDSTRAAQAIARVLACVAGARGV